MFKYKDCAIIIMLISLLPTPSHEALGLFKQIKNHDMKTRFADSSNVMSGSQVAESLPVTPLQAKLNIIDQINQLSDSYRANEDGEYSVNQVIQLSVSYTANEHAEYSVSWDLWPPRTSVYFSQFQSSSPHLHESGIELGPEFHDVTSVTAVFDLPRSRHSLKVIFMNPFGKNENFIQVLNLTQVARFVPHEEFVYEEGRDFEFHVSYNDELEEGREFKQTLIDPETGHLFTKLIDENMFEVADGRQISDNGGEITVRFKSSVYSTSGYLLFSSHVTHDSKVTTINTKQIPIRPSSQSQTFPEGYVSVVPTDFRMSQLVEDTYMVFCDENTECIIECQGAGEQVSFITLQNSQTEELLDHIRTDVTNYIDNNIVSAFYSIPTNRGTTDSRYSCAATSVQGHSDTMNMQVRFYHSARLLKSMSSLRMSVDEANGHIVTFEARCVVEGEPTPNVTFNMDQGWAYSNFVPPDITVPVGNDRFMMKKFVSYDMNDPNGVNSDAYRGRLNSLLCVMEQSILGISLSFDVHNYHVPHPSTR